MRQVLLVEDDTKLALHISTLINTEGYSVQTVGSKAELDEFMVSDLEFSAIILDRLLGPWDTKRSVPDLRRRWPQAPICVLSAVNTPLERAELLDLGVDDYLGKPFFSSELLARLRALLRRRSSAQLEYREIGDLILDLPKRVITKAGTPQALSAKEFLLLKLLSEEPGRVFSKMQLLEIVWGASSETETNVVEVTIANLRKRIAQLGSSVQVKNMRNAGYWLES